MRYERAGCLAGLSVKLAVFSVQFSVIESYGNPEDPVVAEVLGMQIRTKDPVEMQAVIEKSFLKSMQSKTK